MPGDHGAVGAEGHADAHFLGALLDGVGHEAVDRPMLELRAVMPSVT
jgi:hypothetical protein